MVRTIAALDLDPMVQTPGLPGMITLTLPPSWRDVCPDGPAWQRMVKTWRKRWERQWGRPLDGIWKREYQRRGAPHLHVWTVIPPVAGFESWLSRSWTEVVGPRPDEWAKHLAAGTGVDYSDGLRSTDPRRLAVYFSKHGTFSAKGYQDEPPEDWPNPGRVWGVWGLRQAVTEVELRSERERVEVARLLRRATRYRGARRVPRMARPALVDADGVEIRPERVQRRQVHRRMSLIRERASGTVVVADGPALARDLGRYLASIRTP